MGDIETAAKPILIELLHGQPVTLNEALKSKLAAWIALKAIVFDAIDIRDAVFDQASRDEMRFHQTLPQGLSIWVSSHDEPSWLVQCTVAAGLINLNPETPKSGFKNIRTVAIGIGHFFTLAIVARSSDFKFEFEPGGDYDHFIRRLIPLSAEPFAFPLPRLPLDGIKWLSNPIHALMRRRLS